MDVPLKWRLHCGTPQCSDVLETNTFVSFLHSVLFFPPERDRWQSDGSWWSIDGWLIDWRNQRWVSLVWAVCLASVLECGCSLCQCCHYRPVRDLFEGVYLNYDYDIIFCCVFPDGSDFSRGFSITAANWRPMEVKRVWARYGLPSGSASLTGNSRKEHRFFGHFANQLVQFSESVSVPQLKLLGTMPSTDTQRYYRPGG